MSWYALDAIDTAVDEAKELLFPFDGKTWAKLAVLVVFTSGLGLPSNIPTGGFDSPSYDTEGTDPLYESGATDMLDTGVTGLATGMPDTAFTPQMAAVLLLVMVLVLGLMLLSAILEFVYYKSLLDKDVVLRDNFDAYTEHGLHLFGFRLGVMLAAAVVVGGAAFAVYTTPALVVPLAIAAIPLLLVFAVFMQLTNQFIPLVMIDHGAGVIDAWRRFYGTLQQEWKQVAVYVLARFAIGIVVGIIVTLSMLLLLIPLVPIAVIVYLAGLPMVVNAILAVLGILCFLGLALFVLRVPAETYLRYYTILVYRQLDV